MKLINKTGVPVKSSGDGLSHDDVNRLNSTINNLVGEFNDLAKDYCNLNQDLGELRKKMSLKEAISLIPKEKRSFGFKIKFLNLENQWVEYIYFGTVDLDDREWKNEKNWDLPLNIIDGGEW